MRLLTSREVRLVSGADGIEVPWEPDWGLEEGGSRKNNNGYGNGPESGPPPGNSGLHNPQLTSWNRGPRGPR